jgi:hypothetical protein
VLAFHSVPSTIFQIPANNDSQTTWDTHPDYWKCNA